MTVLANWATLVEGLSTSVQDTYSELEDALAAREVPELEISRVEYAEAGMGSAKREYLRIQRKEFVFDVCAAPFGKSFFFSWWMAIPSLPFAPLWTVGFFMSVFVGSFFTYLPFGASGLGFVVLAMAPFAWILVFFTFMKTGIFFDEGTALRIPIVGTLYRLIFAPDTYYAADTQSMFERSVHHSLLEVVEGKISAQGLRALGPDEKRPSRRSTMGLSDLLGMLK